MELKHFTRALQEGKAGVGYHQVWRYTKAGRLPKLITWLAERPELAKALAEDARELAEKSGGPMLPQGRGAAREAA